MTPPRPTDRYGSPRSRTSSRVLVFLLGTAVVLAGIGVAYLGYERFGPKELEGEQISYDVVDDSTVNMAFAVTRKDPSRAVVCIIRARSKDGSETGRREVYVAPSSSGTVQVESTIRTSQPPAIADVYGCSFEVPGYLKTE